MPRPGEMRTAIREAASERLPDRFPRVLLDRDPGDDQESWLRRLVGQVEALAASVTGILETLAEHRALISQLLADRNGTEDGEPAAAQAYWLFVPSPVGYTMMVWESPERLTRGAEVEVDGVGFTVAVVARSPLLDGRPCAYLEPPALGSPRAAAADDE